MRGEKSGRSSGSIQEGVGYTRATRIMTTSSGDVTRLLNQWGNGDAVAFDQLLPLVYRELRKIAKRHIATRTRTIPCNPRPSSMRRN